ncbi:hypothetical protein G6F63_016344 [Rhizopus arrhizus]|nr:hypothetical protein G6F63_016344 [Rhizopus arrhizus]
MSIAAGLVNTLTVAAVAIPLATALGIALGLMRLSSHALAARCAAAIIAPLRNTPVRVLAYDLLELDGHRQAGRHPHPAVARGGRR